MFAPDYPLTTTRLLIRPFEPERDIDALHAYRSRDDVCRYVPFGPRNREQIAERLLDPDSSRTVITADGQALSLAVTLQDTGALIGDLVLFWHSSEHRSAEIGYVINPEYRSHGYATEAAAALLGVAFDGLNAHRVTARIDERNAASMSVVKKLGMRKEARLVECQWLKGEWITLVEFAMLEHEWNREIQGERRWTRGRKVPEHVHSDTRQRAAGTTTMRL
jgi:RimJ/RimL family protein N-acetyltransferase